VGIKLCPVDGDECTRGLVVQECQGQSEEQKPSGCIHEHVEYVKNYDCGVYCGVSIGSGCKEHVDDLAGVFDGVEDHFPASGTSPYQDIDDDGINDEAGNGADDGADDDDDSDNDENDDDAYGEDNETEGDCSNGKYSDNQRSDVPELLFCVSGERKVPSCTMNATEDGAKGDQERIVEQLGISVFWDVERRDVCGVSRERR